MSACVRARFCFRNIVTYHNMNLINGWIIYGQKQLVSYSFLGLVKLEEAR